MSLQATGIFLGSGCLLLAYFYYQKQLIEKEKEAGKTESFGRPKVGGHFSLVDHDGRPVTDLDYRGKYMLFYFGYTVLNLAQSLVLSGCLS